MIESKYLKENIQNIQKLMTIPALRNFETRNLGKLLRLSRIRQYEDGERIISEGDVDPFIFFLLAGKVSVMKTGVEVCQIEQKGELFGEMAIVDNQSRSATVESVGRTLVLAVDTTATSRLSNDDETAIFLLLFKVFAEFMSSRLRLTTEELIRIKEELNRLTKEAE